MIDRQFYKLNSGSSQVEEVMAKASSRAESFKVVLFEYTWFSLAQERLTELRVQLEEQTSLVENLRAALENAENRKDRTSVAELSVKYRVEADARYEIAMAVNILNGINQPEIPAWLTAFFREMS